MHWNCMKSEIKLNTSEPKCAQNLIRATKKLQNCNTPGNGNYQVNALELQSKLKIQSNHVDNNCEWY